MGDIVKITKQHLTVSRKKSDLEKYLKLGWVLVEPLEKSKKKKKVEKVEEDK